MSAEVKVIVVSLFKDDETEQTQIKIVMPGEAVQRGIDYGGYPKEADDCLDFLLGEIARSSDFKKWLEDIE